jgi:hypothetical protein
MRIREHARVADLVPPTSRKFACICSTANHSAYYHSHFDLCFRQGRPKSVRNAYGSESWEFILRIDQFREIRENAQAKGWEAVGSYSAVQVISSCYWTRGYMIYAIRLYREPI